MSIDPFKLPGLIEKRVVINPADISSSDDEGTSYALKSGKEKQKALREKERLRNLRAQAEGTKPSEPPAPAAHAPSADVTEVEPPPSASSNSKRKAPARRGGRGGGAAASSAAAAIDLSDEDLHDEDLHDEAEQIKCKEAKALELSRKRASDFDLDDDEDGSPTPATRGSGPSQRQRVGAAAGTAGAAGAAGAARQALVWIKVRSVDSDAEHLISCPAEVSLADAGLASKAASKHGLDASRLHLMHCDEAMCGRPTPGAALDLSKTARQLGLTGGEGGTARVWVEERAEVLMSLKLRRGQGTAVELRVPPTMSFGEIKRRWLQQHGGGLSPQQVRLEIDGDPLPDEGTPRDANGEALEDGDLLDVVVQ